MATRRKKSITDELLFGLWHLLIGKPKKKPRRSSSGRRKTGSSPANIVRRYQRWAATVDTNRAASLKEKNDLKAKRAKAILDRDREKARAKAERDRKRIAADKARKARMDAAQARRAQQAGPTVRTVPAQPSPARQRASTPAEANLCGARTEDGTPCQNPTTGGPCSAGHNPKAKGHSARAKAAAR